MFAQLQRHGILKEDAERMLVSVTVDGAAVNMGKFSGMKSLFQKDGTEPGTNPQLDYWGWFGCVFFIASTILWSWVWVT